MGAAALAYLVTVKERFLLAWLPLWSVPVTVTVKVPLDPLRLADKVSVVAAEPPEREIGLEVQLGVMPLGSPETDRVTVSESGPVTVTPTVSHVGVLCRPLCDKVIEDLSSDKSRVVAGGGGCVTVRVAVQVSVPPSPVTVPV